MFSKANLQILQKVQGFLRRLCRETAPSICKTHANRPLGRLAAVGMGGGDGPARPLLKMRTWKGKDRSLKRGPS